MDVQESTTGRTELMTSLASVAAIQNSVGCHGAEPCRLVNAT